MGLWKRHVGNMTRLGERDAHRKWDMNVIDVTFMFIMFCIQSLFCLWRKGFALHHSLIVLLENDIFYWLSIHFDVAGLEIERFSWWWIFIRTDVRATGEPIPITAIHSANVTLVSIKSHCHFDKRLRWKWGKAQSLNLTLDMNIPLRASLMLRHSVQTSCFVFMHNEKCQKTINIQNFNINYAHDWKINLFWCQFVDKTTKICGRFNWLHRKIPQMFTAQTEI